jgi:hypothetical protein
MPYYIRLSMKFTIKKMTGVLFKIDFEKAYASNEAS